MSQRMQSTARALRAATFPARRAGCAPGVKSSGGVRLPGAQRGVALVVALILLVVITLIGLAAVSGTIMQSKMAANQYDRQTAFQNAESALRAAQAQLRSGNVADVSTRWCGADSSHPTYSACLANPFTDDDLPAGSIHLAVAGTAAGQYTAAALATGQPAYVIENMGDWVIPKSNLGSAQLVNCHQAGTCGVGQTVTYYRITARSGDPATVGDRAVVTLQAVIKQH